MNVIKDDGKVNNENRFTTFTACDLHVFVSRSTEELFLQ